MLLQRVVKNGATERFLRCCTVLSPEAQSAAANLA